MRILDGELILSPSDLTGVAACAHLTQLDLRAVRGEIEKPRREDPLLEVLAARGAEHEAQVLAAAQSEAATAGGGCLVADLPGVVTVDGPTKTRTARPAALPHKAELEVVLHSRDRWSRAFADFEPKQVASLVLVASQIWCNSRLTQVPDVDVTQQV